MTYADDLDAIHDRRDEVLCAAAEVFCECGFAGATMLAIAKRAKASKETLYSWFGTKVGLFEALIRWRMDRVALHNQQAFDTHINDPIEMLRQFSLHYLGMVLMTSTIAMQRIAIGEANSFPQLGQVIHEAGQLPTVAAAIQCLERCKLKGRISYNDAQEVAELYLSMLCGSWEYTMLLGQLSEVTQEQIEHRVETVIGILLKTYK